MSRTHKTKPWKVKVKQGLVPTREIHHHFSGECNLKEDEHGVRWWGYSDRCYREMLWDGRNYCCNDCHYAPDKVDQYHREQRGIKQGGGLLKDWEDYDVG